MSIGTSVNWFPGSGSAIQKPFNNSFVEILKNNSSIRNCYFIRKATVSNGFGLGCIVNGEAVQIDFGFDVDNFCRLYNIFSNVLDGSGDIMLLAGASRLSSGILEYAVRAKKSGDETAYQWIPNHSATVGATIDIDLKIYMDGVLTDVTAIADGTIVTFEDFLMIQRYTGYNWSDPTTALFDITTTHRYKEGVLSISNSLTALENLTMYDGYSGKLTGYDNFVEKVKLDNETIIPTTGTNAYTLYDGSIMSAAYFSDASKYALAIEIGQLEESISYKKPYSAAPYKLLHWDRSPNNSVYFLWTPRDIEVEVPQGTRFTSTNKIFATTNVNNVIK